MREKAVRGIPWTVSAYAANRAISVGTTVVLARLLTPTDFGVFAMATLMTGLLALFSGLGLGSVLVLRRDLDARGQGTILSLLLLSGVVFAGVIALVAPLVARLFGEPRVSEVLIVLGVILAVSGANWFYESVLQRELEFRRRFVVQVVSTATFSVTALALGVTDFGVWALVGGEVGRYLTTTVMLMMLAPYRVRPAFNLRVARDAARDGAGFVVQQLASFVQRNSDYAIIGRLLPAAQLGFYSMAYRQAELTFYAIADPVARVTFPAFVEMRQEGRDLSATFLSALRLVALAAWPFGVVLSAAAEPFAVGLFGSEWLPMAPALTALGIWAMIRPVEVTAAWMLNSSDRARLVGWLSAALALPMLPALYLAAKWGGISAVAWTVVGFTAVGTAALMVVVGRLTGATVARQRAALLPLAVAGCIGWVATRAVADALADGWALGALAASASTAFLVYLVVLAVVDRDLLRDARAKVSRAIGRKSPSTATAAP